MKNFSLEQFESWIRHRSEPKWFTEQRRAALAIFEKTPYPNWNEEAWRRLPWQKIPFDGFPPSFKVDEPAFEPPKSLREQGVILVTLSEALRSHSNLLERYWTRVISPEGQKFESLATAFATHGAFLYIPSVEVSEPVLIRWEGKLEEESLFPHLLIIAEPNSRAVIIDQSSSLESKSPGFVYGIVEILAARGSQIDFLSTQEYSRNLYSFTTYKARIEQDAQVQFVLLGLGSRVARSRIESSLVASGAQAELLGFFFGEGDQHFDVNTLQDHQAPHTRSDLLFKSALRDEARSVYYGLIRVHKGAQQTDAYQANRNLLLSDGAKADSIPVLEIEADDVRCTHGAAVGPVDEEQRFYLMSRGLDRDAADRLLLAGFFEQGIGRIRHSYLRQWVKDRLSTRIQLELASLLEQVA